MPQFRKPMIAALPEPETVDFSALAGRFAGGELDLAVVLGPTASGKTRYAVRLAKALAESAGSAEIISADSRQVYRGMDIGTGKDLAEYDGVPYHLIDIRHPGEQYNVYEFREDFFRAYEDIRRRGAVPVLCGGTGLYINSVVNGYDFKDSRPLSAERVGSTVAGALSPGRIFVIGTLVSREERNARIDARLQARMQEGMVEEIRSLLDGSNPGCKDGKPVPAEVLLGYGLEYKYVTEFVQGLISEEELFRKLSTAIHQFAKRQMTWFRGMERSGIKIHWVQV